MGRKRGVMRTECKDTRASHRKKRIGIGGNLMFMEGGIFPGYGKSYVNDDYVQAVASAGGVPMILPVTDEEDIVEAQIEAVDGLVISGGWDVDPLLWGEEPHEKLGSTLPVRDTFDRLLIAAARRRGLRRRDPEHPSTLPVPFGPVIPVIAVLVSLWLLVQADLHKILFGLSGLLIAVPFYFLMRKQYLQR